MPSRKRPRRGSLQFWPRKRAKRIYPRISHWGKTKDVKPLGFAGWKAGMTHIQYIDGDNKSPTRGKRITKTVTIIDAPSLFVCGIKFYASSPSSHVVSEIWSKTIPKSLHLNRKTHPGTKGAVPEHYDDVRLIVCTQPEKSGMHQKKPEVFELGIGGDNPTAKKEYAESVLGKEISAKDSFKQGQYIDVSAVTKGHGFTGVIKRFGVMIQGRKDKKRHRHVGSLGSTTPRKLDWRVPMPGQYGFFNRTEWNKRIILIDNDPKKITPAGGFIQYGLIPESYVMIGGSVPGPKKRLVMLRNPMRTTKTQPIEIKSISVQSKQGR